MPPTEGPPYNTLASGCPVAIGAQVAADPLHTGFSDEFADALTAVVDAAETASAAPPDVLQLRVFVTDLATYATAADEVDRILASRFPGRRPEVTVAEVAAIPGGRSVQVEAFVWDSGRRNAPAAIPGISREAADALLRLRLAPHDARYAGSLAAGSKALEVFADLETELSLIEGGDEGLCVGYESVEFLAPLRVGDFVEGRARIVARGRTSRTVDAELYKVLSVDASGIGGPEDIPVLAARARATIVVGRRFAADPANAA